SAPPFTSRSRTSEAASKSPRCAIPSATSSASSKTRTSNLKTCASGNCKASNMLAHPVAIVTGAGRGLGKRIAATLAQRGHGVVVAGPDLAELQQTAADVQGLQMRALAVAADVTREDDVQALAERTLREFGRIDVLVNNAGIIGPTALLSNVAKKDWD